MSKTFKKRKATYEEVELTDDNIFEYLVYLNEDEVLGFISEPHEPRGVAFKAIRSLAAYPEHTKEYLDKIGLELRVKHG